MTPSLDIGDLGAGAVLNHRIAVNTWQGIDVPQLPPGVSRMRNFSIRFDTHDRFSHLLGTLSNDSVETYEGAHFKDPS